MSSESSPPSPSKDFDIKVPLEALDTTEPPESPESSISDSDDLSRSAEDTAEAPAPEDPKVASPTSYEQAIVWYAGLLREISPFDEATWDYDVDLDELTKSDRYALPIEVGDEVYEEMKERVEMLPIEQVEKEAAEGDMWMQVELAVRLVCGLTIESDSARAEKILKAICKLDNDAPSTIHTRAAAERFDAWLDSFMFYSATRDTDEPCYEALYCAGRRCARALWVETVPPKSKPSLIPSPIAPIDLRVADALYRHVEQGDFEGKKLDPTADEKFEKLRLAWLDYTVRRYVLLRYGPRAKICAHGPCGSRGTEEQPLFRCEGKCLPGWKPLYCSKECQEKEARQHRKFCNDTVLSRMPEKTLIRSLYSTSQMRRHVGKPLEVEHKIERTIWVGLARRALGVEDSEPEDS
ncbi:unnamed protein product [Peniophora sp. CBMAI 1063]|nr:unnamed protein product [Peniophora sp. CBMAI 1063]